MNIRSAGPGDQADLASFDCGFNEPFQVEIYDWIRGEAWEWSLAQLENRLYVLIDDDASLAGVLAYESGSDTGSWFFKAIGIRRDLHDTRHLGTILFQHCLSELMDAEERGSAFWKVHPDNLASLKISHRVTDDDGYMFLGNHVFTVMWGMDDL